jgi:hypothetical protein
MAFMYLEIVLFTQRRRHHKPSHIDEDSSNKIAYFVDLRPLHFDCNSEHGKALTVAPPLLHRVVSLDSSFCCESAARTERSVCTRGGRENAQRKMRAACEMPYHGICEPPEWYEEKRLSSERASRFGKTLRNMKMRASRGDCDHSIPGSAWILMFDHETSEIL